MSDWHKDNLAHELEAKLARAEAQIANLRCVEDECIALATANSELRSELGELKALLRMVTHG